MRNYLRTLIRKWIDKMQYKIEHDIDKPEKIEGLEKLIEKEEFDKLIEKDIWKKTSR